MKILFTHAYYMVDDAKEQKIQMPYVPLGLLYISAWLEKNNWKNDVYDTTFSKQADHFKYILSYMPDVIGIYTNLMTKIKVVELIRFIKSKPELSESLIVLGGHDTTFNIENYLQVGADVLIIGEGEESMLDVVKAHAQNRHQSFKFSTIEGIAFKDSAGDIIKTRPRSKIKSLDVLPFPARDKIDLPQYLSTWKSNHGYSSLSISTQRGCPYTCKWCSTAVYGQSYRRRSPVHVIQEIIEIQKTYAPDQFWFVDDVFTIHHGWLTEFEEELKRKNIKIHYECITRADRLNETVLKVLKETGCKRVWIGAESGSQNILDAMDRRVKADQVRNMILKAREQGIGTGTFIMLGYPGEQEEDIKTTLHHLKLSNPDQFTITLTYPIKGTELYNELSPFLKGELPWDKSTDRDIKFKRTYHERYYTFAIRWIYNTMNIQNLPERNPIQTLILSIKVLLSRFGMMVYKNI